MRKKERKEVRKHGREKTPIKNVKPGVQKIKE